MTNNDNGDDDGDDDGNEDGNDDNNAAFVLSLSHDDAL